MTAEEWLGYGAIYLFLCALVAWFAESRGHRPLAWFSIALVFSPLLAFIIAVLSGPAKELREPTVCSHCGKPQSPYWTTKCNHCGALYSDYAPVAKT